MPARACRYRSFLAASLACLLCVLSGGVAAAQTDSEREKAGQLVEDGLQKARSGKFAAAAERFEAAFKLFPHPDILHNLARANEELGELATAHGEFRRALEMDPKYTFAADARERLVDLEQRLRTSHGLVRVTSTPSQVELSMKVDGRAIKAHLITPAERWVPAGTLVVGGTRPGFVDGSTEVQVAAGADVSVEVVLKPVARKGFLGVVASVDGARVTLDGEVLGKSPVASQPWPQGTYLVRVEAPGYQAFESRVVVNPDEETLVQANLVAIGGSTGPPPANPRRTRIGVGLLSSGIAVGVVGGVAHGLAFKDAKDAEQVPNDPTTDADDKRFDSLKSSAEGKQVAAFVSYGVGAALAGVGIYLLLSGGSQSTAEVAARQVTPLISAGRDGLGLGARLSF